MDHKEHELTLQKGIEAAEKGFIHSAQLLLNESAEHDSTPELHSYLAYCLAKSEGRTSAAAKTCRESLKREPDNSVHYLLLGRIQLLAGEKSNAVRTLRQGLKIHPNPKIVVELKQLGLRRPVVFKNLERGNLLNRLCGKLLKAIGLRR